MLLETLQKLSQSYREYPKSFAFSNSIFLCWLTVSLCVLTAPKFTDFTVYIMAIALCLQMSTFFLRDIIKKVQTRKYYYFFVIILGVPAITTYIILISGMQSLGFIYFAISLFITMFLSPDDLFPLIILFGCTVGYILYVFDQKFFCIPNLSAMQIFAYIQQVFVVLLVWKLLYQVKNRELNQKEQNLKEIALSVAHELSTHLAALKVNTAQLKKGLLEPSDTRSLKRIDYILKDATVYLEILQSNFKDYLPKAKWDTFDVLSSLEQIINDYPLDADQKTLITISGDSFQVKFDQRAFRIIFMNLIKNALFFIEKAEKGKVIITLQRGERLNTIFFKDTSYGIRSDFIEKIFDRFFSRRRHGTGLGLYFCKTAMQNFKGDITCDSKFGEYTNFTLTFPKVNQ